MKAGPRRKEDEFIIGFVPVLIAFIGSGASLEKLLQRRLI